MAGRRGNREGTITQRANGSFRGQVLVVGVRHSVSGKTKKEVQEKLRKLVVDADRGILPPTERLTLGQLLDRWLADVVRHSRRPNTYRNYADMARLYLRPAFGNMKLTQLQAPQIQRLYTTMLDRGLAPKTIKIAHGVLHCVLEQAVAWNLVPRNVAALATPPRAKRKEIKALDPEQARTLIATAAGTRWAALIALAVATGMRQGELLGVRWGDLDLIAGVVRCTRQLTRDGEFSELKNDKHRRSIDLPASTAAALREHKRSQDEERLLVGCEWQDYDLVFCTHVGKPLNWRNVSRDFKGLLRRAGVPDLPFHGLRHSSATLLLAQGVHPKVVQERLGHSNIGMTLDIYSHVLPRLGQEAAAKLDALLA